jgi:hypothetical protein
MDEALPDRQLADNQNTTGIIDSPLTIISVIGHGPSPAGQRLGRIIDEHPVIRMHDTAWQTPADYGTRRDYTILPGPWGARGTHPNFHVKFTRLNAPRVAWLSFTFKNPNIVKTHLGKPVYWYDLEWFCERLKSGRHSDRRMIPTRGVAAALIAMELGAETVRLVGFDDILAGKISGYAPGAGRVKRSGWVGQTFNACHDYERDRDLLFQIASDMGVTIEALGSEIKHPHLAVAPHPTRPLRQPARESTSGV